MVCPPATTLMTHPHAHTRAHLHTNARIMCIHVSNLCTCRSTKMIHSSPMLLLKVKVATCKNRGQTDGDRGNEKVQGQVRWGVCIGNTDILTKDYSLDRQLRLRAQNTPKLNKLYIQLHIDGQQAINSSFQLGIKIQLKHLAQFLLHRECSNLCPLLVARF